ncbi:hypothetical protein LSH36_197g04000 [Paralvinella palmiformis]|uniref:Uncharacterized protein n=1 Tax=Paralvinella palmiformis TaxID=53620 RepID=A0AAD9N6T3_9ANNE|nr:hypothetical protein LSH36_197g04000 [Paralvinella palmiformis]
MSASVEYNMILTIISLILNISVTTTTTSAADANITHPLSYSGTTGSQNSSRNPDPPRYPGTADTQRYPGSVDPQQYPQRYPGSSFLSLPSNVSDDIIEPVGSRDWSISLRLTPEIITILAVYGLLIIGLLITNTIFAVLFVKFVFGGRFDEYCYTYRRCSSGINSNIISKV